MNPIEKFQLKPVTTSASLGAHQVLIVVLDGVGYKDIGTNLTLRLSEAAEILPVAAYQFGNAVNAAFTPHLAQLFSGRLFRTLQAHGPSVGLPSVEDMGNSEVGHNALGAGRVFDQGALLVKKAFETGDLFRGEGWKKTILREELKNGSHTLHLCGLLSDGNVHSHIDHLLQLIQGAKVSGVRKVRLHILLDGRDVSPKSALEYLEKLEDYLTLANNAHFDCRVASGGGRMFVTMDRYESDWRIVERGYHAHVLGDARPFLDPKSAILTFRKEGDFVDQDLPPFVIVDDGLPIGTVHDGDSFILFNFRGDRAIQISRALTEVQFTGFPRKRFPRVHFAGMTQYDGDLKIPAIFLVKPPLIDQTMGELLADARVPQFACSETQKYGHVTFFWNGNRSGKFNEELENYVEIPSDLPPFSDRPWMKAAEIADATIQAMKERSFRVGRINFANGDMVGHTGDFAASIVAMNAVDLSLGRILKAAKETNTIVLVTADHGNADELFEINKKSGKVVKDERGFPKQKTSHTLTPVPFAIYNSEVLESSVTFRSDLPMAGLANVAATVLEIAGFVAPPFYEPSLLVWEKKNSGSSPRKEVLSSGVVSSVSQNKDENFASGGKNFDFAQAALAFRGTIATLRGPHGCPWDKEQTIQSLQRYMIEECYEAVAAAEKISSSPHGARDFCDELGDVLLQVFLNAQVAEDEKRFSIQDVFAAIDEKMVRRHPHVFQQGDSEVKTATDVVKQWDEIKGTENSSLESQAKSLSLLAKALKKSYLPTLNYAFEVSKRAKRLGFAWPDLAGTFQDVESEVDELKRELFVANPDWSKVIDEVGDVVFTLANLIAYLKDAHPECESYDLDIAARQGVEKFVARFKEMEKIMQERGVPLTEDSAKGISLDAWNELWKEAKLRRYR